MARGGRRLRAAAADARARSHGHRRAREDVSVPRIVITPCRKVADYVESVRVAGGDPVVARSDRRGASEQLAGADGLLLTGGGDVDPVHYGEPKHETFSAAEPGRDEAELSLAREAMARRTAARSRSAAACRCSTSPPAARWSRTSPRRFPMPSIIARRSPPAEPAHHVTITPGTHLAGLIADDLDRRRGDGEQPPSPGGRPSRAGVRRQRRRARRCGRGDRSTGSAVLPRRAVAPGELRRPRAISSRCFAGWSTRRESSLFSVT